MRESAQIAHSYVRSKAESLGVDPSLFEANDVHLHVPAGAIPKDGPSREWPWRWPWRAFSAEDDPRGLRHDGRGDLARSVLPVGGIKMKVLAAHRAGLSTVILPTRKRERFGRYPQEVRDTLRIVLVDRIDEAMAVAFGAEARQEINILN